MSGRRWLWVLALGAAAASVACSDSVGPTTPLQKKATLAKPTGGSFGRYILISGVVACVEDCDDDGDPGQKVEGLPGTIAGTIPDTLGVLGDTLGVLGIPADTSSVP